MRHCTRRLSGRIGTILPQILFFVRRAGGLIVLHKWALALVLILCCVS